ncbi:methionine adenosyltransferase [Murdochiella vaginalis]|uniref:methionine adenosyltransferase n=1 Tax=Murdochiella vaginalis TaxID=1852373 RepID=UPI0008FD98D8|nr:methionine adenosyltransferase [Murdochiella vaginalis]
MTQTIKSAESVRAGHPDKLCDQIADAVLDKVLTLDPEGRCACEAMATEGNIYVAGEISCKETLNIVSIVKDVLRRTGYSTNRIHIHVHIHAQSQDIAGGVDHALETRTSTDQALGAGDQGTVVGFATDETSELLPLPLVLSHRICQKLDGCMKEHTIDGLRPDGKAQVSIAYQDGKPARIKSIVVSAQHTRQKDLSKFAEEIREKVLIPAFASFPFDEETEIYINPSGRFVLGGHAADTGLTGRKLMVDTYGGLALHGGGAFSGKDPTKVDRSSAYMARAIARNVVMAGLAKKCQISISYAIGKAEPVALAIDTFGTGTASDERILSAIGETFDLRPQPIIETLSLMRPIYSETSVYGHFKNSSHATWEKLDKTAILREAVRG